MSKMICDPDELAELVRRGDIQALDHMTRCFGDRLIAVGRRVCGNAADADDAVQDALLGAGKSLQSWRGDGRIEAWLRRMVVNACHHMRRGRKNDPALHDYETTVSTDINPEQLAVRSELAATLAQGLAELQPRDRTIVILADVEGWKGPEIARRLEMTPGAVRTRLSRSRSRLRAYIAEASTP